MVYDFTRDKPNKETSEKVSSLQLLHPPRPHTHTLITESRVHKHIYAPTVTSIRSQNKTSKRKD